jgi:hypothetical protein
LLDKAAARRRLRKTKGATERELRNPSSINGAADRIRTGDVQLGKLAFCH